MISRGFGGGAGKCSMITLRCLSGPITRLSITNGSLLPICNGDGGRSRMMRGGGVFGLGACLYITNGGRVSSDGS